MKLQEIFIEHLKKYIITKLLQIHNNQNNILIFRC